MVESLFEGLEQYEKTPWQEKDLRYLGPMPYSANWSEMGTFKTSTFLWLMERKKVKNAIIVTSKVGKGSYFSDFYRCLPEAWDLYNLNIHDAVMRRGDFEKKVDLDKLLREISVGNHNHPKILLAHYDVFTNAANNTSRKRNEGVGIIDKLVRMNWDMVTCDEAHRLKNPKSQWTRNIKRVARKSKNRHIMTGTGFVNNPAEMWSLLNFLNPSEFSSYWAFRNYYCDQYLDMRGYRVIRGILPYRVEEFRKLRQRMGPRHTMEEVHNYIQKPVEKTYEIDLNTTQRRMYNEIKSALQTLDQQGMTLSSPNVLSQLNRLRQISVATPEVQSFEFNAKQQRMVHEIKLVDPSAKLDLVMQILDELDEDQKVVVFSNFTDPLTLLAERMEKQNIGYVHTQQRHNEEERYRLWHDEFRKPGKQVFLSTLALGGESINLSCAKYLIFLDRSWSPKDMMQAVGRVYRPGQTGAVEIIHINARNTVDSYVKSKLDIKGRWFNEIFKD